MKNKIRISLLFGFLAVSLFLTGQTIWKQVNPMPPNNVKYYDVHFINPQEGWVVGEFGNILHTPDAAVTWESLAVLTNEDLRTVFFLDSLEGWVAGKQVYHTTNGGISWESIFGTGLNTWFYGIHYFNHDTGMITSTSGKIHKTTDAGLSWEMKYQSGSWITDLFFLDYYLGWALGRYKIFKTYDGGNEWEETATLYFGNGLNDLFFLNADTGWIASPIEYSHSGYFHTIDGGYTWDTILLESNGISQAVRFYDENLGFIFAEYNAYKTTNGGNSWTDIDAPDIAQITQPMGDFMCGVGGESMNYSHDLANSWSSPAQGSITDLNAVARHPVVLYLQ